MNELNVFHISGTSYKITDKIKYFFRGIKYGYQRATRGFCDADTWDLDYYYLRILKDSLKKFVELNNGWPDSKYETFDEYTNDILAQIKKLEYLTSDSDDENEYWEEYGNILASTQKIEPATDASVRIYWDMNEEQNKVEEKFHKRSEEIRNNRKKILDEVLDWLKEHIRDLWW